MGILVYSSIHIHRSAFVSVIMESACFVCFYVVCVSESDEEMASAGDI